MEQEIPNPVWSAPDPEGLVTCWLTARDKATLKGRRLRKAPVFRLPLLDAWPTARRDLLVSWLAIKAKRIRHDTLLKKAGAGSVALAESLLQELLLCGALELDEQFRGGLWWPLWLRFLHIPPLVSALGLPDPEALRKSWQAARQMPLADAQLQSAAEELAKLPPGRALARLELLRALALWREDERCGTWRDFAQFARGDTKAITEAERNWLGTSLDLDDLGISGHEPMLLLAAPLRLEFENGTLDLAAPGDFVALTAKSVAASRAVIGEVNQWHLVENRTSFERVARRGEGGTIWLPGFPPRWWQKAVRWLIGLAPAPARIACDPDPAGLEICLQAASLWRDAGLPWSPWHMAPGDLDALPARKPLSPRDRERLLALRATGLPHPQLEALARHMEVTGEKGEQEAGL